MAENINVKITMNGGGEIELELYSEVAPETVSNFKFCSLAILPVMAISLHKSFT